MTPGSCSTGIHILLETCEAVFEVQLVNLLAGDHQTANYLSINPKGSIPALKLQDGRVLTDFLSIAWWLAQTFPRAKLLPENPEDQISILDSMSYIVATLHMQGFARLFTSEQFTPNPADHQQVKQQGLDIIKQGFAVIDGRISAQSFLTDRLSIADAVLFYVEFWADKTDIDLPENCQRHYHNMLQLPAVRQVLMEEGYRV